MADITITAASVRLVSGPTEQMRAGGATTAGQVIIKEAATGLAKLGDNDSPLPELRSAYGLALNGAAIYQPLMVARNGAVVDVGAVLTAGTDYYLSGAPGSICPRADVIATDDPVRIGMALSTSLLQIDFADPNVTL